VPRPKEAILSQNLIRDQALAIIDEDGLDALTMRRLADRLSVQAASLYTHFPNKEAVLDAIAERLAKRIDPTGFADSWQVGLRVWANSYYAAIHWHPHAAPVVASGARGHNVNLAVADQIHAGLMRHGWPAPDAAMAATAVKFLVLGAATAPPGIDDSDDAPVRRAGGRATDRLPGSGIEQLADTLARASFTFALDSLIGGLDSYYETLNSGKGRPAPSRSTSPATKSVTPHRAKSASASTRELNRAAGGRA
jgi:AcrR family transcriptional regulator